MALLLRRRGAPTVLGRAVRRLSYPAHTIVPMPALSPTMQQGNIASWKVKEGDEVASGDVIAEVETDKATVDFDTQDDGVIAKILMPEGCAPLALIPTSAPRAFCASPPRQRTAALLNPVESTARINRTCLI